MAGKSIKGRKVSTAPGVRTITGDSFNNRALRLGLGSGNAIGQAQYNVDFLTNDYGQLRQMYRCNWVCRKIVDLAPRDMLRSGFDLTGEIEPKQIQKIKAVWEKKKINAKLFKTLSYARLFGGAIAFVLIEGQKLSDPLRLDTIKKGQFVGIKLYDRWQVVPSVQVDPEDEEPVYYNIVPILGDYTGQMDSVLSRELSGNICVHASRCIKIIGDELPYIDWINNMRWGASILEGINDRLNYYNTASAALTSMILKAGFRVVKIDGFKDVVANRKNDSNSSYSKLEKLMGLMSYTQGLEGSTIIDAKDSIEVAGYNFQNLDKIMDLLKEQLCGATEYTVSRFFQEKKTGLNSNADGEERAYYDEIDSARISKLTPGYRLLLDICYRHEFGTAPPEDYGFEFEPLWQLSDVEKADIAVKVSTAVTTVTNAGVLNKDTALKELKQSSETTGIFSNIDDKEITDAENEDPPTGENLMPTSTFVGKSAVDDKKESSKSKDAAFAQWHKYLRKILPFKRAA